MSEHFTYREQSAHYFTRAHDAVPSGPVDSAAAWVRADVERDGDIENVFAQLGEMWGDMARGIATVTGTPAQSVGLTDRGRIGVGLRADLVRFTQIEGAAVAREVFSQGRQVA